VAEGGAIQFEIKAAVILEEGQFLRAGYSATADVVLDERKQVLAVSERLVQYDGEQPYVDVLVGENTYERRDLEVGLSDGLMTEVRSGLEVTDAVKIWNQPRYE
jgi:HlyD family secretion protein